MCEPKIGLLHGNESAQTIQLNWSEMTYMVIAGQSRVGQSAQNEF